VFGPLVKTRIALGKKILKPAQGRFGLDVSRQGPRGPPGRNPEGRTEAFYCFVHPTSMIHFRKRRKGEYGGHRRLLFHRRISLNPEYVKEKIKEERAFYSSFFDFFDLAVKNFSNSGNFAAIGT
jgi:hypothetical protein